MAELELMIFALAYCDHHQCWYQGKLRSFWGYTSLLKCWGERRPTVTQGKSKKCIWLYLVIPLILIAGKRTTVWHETTLYYLNSVNHPSEHVRVKVYEGIFHYVFSYVTELLQAPSLATWLTLELLLLEINWQEFPLLCPVMCQEYTRWAWHSRKLFQTTHWGVLGHRTEYVGSWLFHLA